MKFHLFLIFFLTSFVFLLNFVSAQCPGSYNCPPGQVQCGEVTAGNYSGAFVDEKVSQYWNVTTSGPRVNISAALLHGYACDDPGDDLDLFLYPPPGVSCEISDRCVSDTFGTCVEDVYATCKLLESPGKWRIQVRSFSVSEGCAPYNVSILATSFECCYDSECDDDEACTTDWCEGSCKHCVNEGCNATALGYDCCDGLEKCSDGICRTFCCLGPGEICYTFYDGFEDGDISGWDTGGDANWFVDSSTAYSGSYSARGGVITHNQKTFISKTFDLDRDMTLEFYWKVSSESYYDRLLFCLDNPSCTRTSGYTTYISGTTSWAKKSYALSAGSHIINFTYWKDGSVNSGSDTGWIDEVQVYSNSDCCSGVCNLHCCLMACPSDGYHCSGNVSEQRDYYCNSTGHCVYDVISSNDCDADDKWVINQTETRNYGCMECNVTYYEDHYCSPSTGTCTYVKEDYVEICSNVREGERCIGKGFCYRCSSGNCVYDPSVCDDGLDCSRDWCKWSSCGHCTLEGYHNSAGYNCSGYSCCSGLSATTCPDDSTVCCPPDGWHDISGWVYYNLSCARCKDQELRDYSCPETEGSNCPYDVTDTRVYCENANEGKVCNESYECKDTCTKAMSQYTCQSGNCRFKQWTGETLCNPFSCSGIGFAWVEGCSGYSSIPNCLWDQDVIISDGYGIVANLDQVIASANMGKFVIVNVDTYNSARSEVGSPPQQSYTSRGYTTYYFSHGEGYIVNGGYDYLGYYWKYYVDKQNRGLNFKDLILSIGTASNVSGWTRVSYSPYYYDGIQDVGQYIAAEECSNTCEFECGADLECSGESPGSECAPGRSCNEYCQCIICLIDGFCDVAGGETYINCPDDCCRDDCTAIDDPAPFCRSKCDGYNGCSINPWCDGKSIGEQCLDDNQAITCCEELATISCLPGCCSPGAGCVEDGYCNPLNELCDNGVWKGLEEHCGDGICECGEGIENCPQDCVPFYYKFYTGWNLISLPYKKIEGIVTDTCNSGRLPFFYWTDGKWKKVIGIMNIEPGHAYWVNPQWFTETEECIVNVTVSALENVTVEDLPSLHKGYNEIGAPLESKNINNIKGSCSISIGPLYWNALPEQKRWERTDTLLAKRGYWIFVDEDCELEEP